MSVETKSVSLYPRYSVFAWLVTNTDHLRLCSAAPGLLADIWVWNESALLSKHSIYIIPYYSIPDSWVDPHRKCQNPSGLSMRHTEVLGGSHRGGCNSHSSYLLLCFDSGVEIVKLTFRFLKHFHSEGSWSNIIYLIRLEHNRKQSQAFAMGGGGRRSVEEWEGRSLVKKTVGFSGVTLPGEQW